MPYLCVALMAPHPTCGVLHRSKQAAARHRIFRRGGKRIEVITVRLTLEQAVAYGLGGNQAQRQRRA